MKCAVCGSPTTKDKGKYRETCSYACANKLRAKRKAEELQTFEVAGKKMTASALKHLEVWASTVSIRAHELSIRKSLPPKLLPYWIGFLGEKTEKLRQLQSKEYTPCPCGTYVADGSKKHASVYCSHEHYAKYSRKSERPLRNEVWAFVTSCGCVVTKKKFYTTSPLKFTAQDSVRYKKLCESPDAYVTGPEWKHIQFLQSSNKLLAKKYVRLFADSMKGRQALALGKSTKKCLGCGKEIELHYNDLGIERDFCAGGICSNKHPRTQRRKVAACKKKYGVDYQLQRPEVLENVLSKAFKHTAVKLGNRTCHVQGYEPYAIQRLMELKINPKNIVVGIDKVPTVQYQDGKVTRTYFPDIYLPKKNALIEVKSTWTLAGTRALFRKNCLKARACVNEGYDFRLWLYSKEGQRIRLPSEWWRLSYKQISYRLKEST